MWELDCEESWVPTIDAFELWCWRRLLRVPWTARRSNQSILKEISLGCSLEGMMLKLKLQYFGPLHTKSWLIGKDSDAGRDWGQEEKGTTEDEMARWHHELNGHESDCTPGDGDEQGGLACCDSWGGKESDTTERLNWTELHYQSLRLCAFLSFSLSFSLFHFLIIDSRPPGSGPLKDPKWHPNRDSGICGISDRGTQDLLRLGPIQVG